jgi:hypothetical protein
MENAAIVEREGPSEASETAIARLPERLAVIKMQDESIMAMAAARPRSHIAILEEVKHQIVAYPSFARAAMYRKPVGKDESGKMKYAEGLSIRAAEALRNAYGYNKVTTEIEPLDPENMRVRVTATFTDYQTGSMWTDSGIISRRYKKRMGGTALHDEDRFFNVVCKAEVSRRVREVVLRSVPPGLKAELEEAVEETVSRLLTPEVIDKIVALFAKKGANQEMLEKHLGKPRDSWDEEDRLTLQGVFNALEEGETTLQEVFGGAGESGPGTAQQEAQQKNAESVRAAVDKARGGSKSAGKTQDPKPAPNTADPGPPPRWETLAIMLAETVGCDIERATTRLDEFARKMFNKPLVECSDATLSNMERRVKDGTITVAQ